MIETSEDHFYNVTQPQLSLAQRDRPQGIGWLRTMFIKHRILVNSGLASETELWVVVPHSQDEIIKECRKEYRESK